MNVRKLALEAIEKIINQRAFSNLVVHEYLQKFEMTKDDRGLFTNLVYGTVQYYLFLEFQLEPFIGKKKQKSWVKHLLFMSVYQLMYLSIPDYAVLNEAVDIANVKDRFIGKFINAVLRSFLRAERRSLENLDDITRLSIQYSHPSWLVAYFLKDYSLPVVEQILSENCTIKKEFIRVNTLKCTNEEAEEYFHSQQMDFQKATLTKNAYVLNNSIVRDEWFLNGNLTIQDLSAQWISERMNVKPGDVVIDLCAAPGGKSAHLAALMMNKGKIFACDVHTHKMQLLKETFQRLGVSIATILEADARSSSLHLDAQIADFVLADVPCSGLGVISHKVDLKYHMNLDSIEEIKHLQKEILDSSCNLVKVGGIYAYSTCTINKEENEQQINEFLKRNSGFDKVFEQTILPHEYHSDGFYLCLMQRRS